MSDQVKKDIVVVAREGYSVLLEVDGRMFNISCHDAVNLSNIFSVDILENCPSLSAHLKDGNLVFFEEGTELPKDVTASAEIIPLRGKTSRHIEAQYKQAERDARRTNMELETRVNITENTRKLIQDQVQEGKKEILQEDEKFLTKTAQTVTEAANPPVPQQKSMTAEELTMKVSMDVDPETFAKKQAASRDTLAAAKEADEARAEKEIAEQNAKQNAKQN